jgi:Domain of unknown function (DUF4399)/Family of unknown function (DUF6130)
MRLRPPVVALAVATAVLLAATACGSGGDGGDDGAVLVPTTAVEAGPPTSAGPPAVLAIVSPATGALVAGNVVRLDLTSSGITIVPADGGTGSRRGHYHVFIDREPVDSGAVIPVAADIIHTADDPIVIPGFTVGPHRISVIFGDGTHRRIGLNEASTSFTVAGPAIDASAPPNVSAGQPVVLQVQVTGLAVPGDALLYVLLDRDAPPPGQPIPDEPGVRQASETTITVPDVAPGTHTLWVVAGSADRVPLDPPVADKLTVTVG